MKKFILIFAIVGLIITQKTVEAENKETINKDSITINDYYIDFAVPDLGAFTLLNTKPDFISSPGNPKEFSASLLNAIGNRTNIPPGIAIEWSPYKTFTKITTLKQYEKNRWLKDMQVSYGTLADSLGTKVALGFKWTWNNHIDPLLDENYQKQLILMNHEEFRSNTIDIYKMVDVFQFFLSDLLKNRNLSDSDKVKSFISDPAILDLIVMKDTNQINDNLHEIKSKLLKKISDGNKFTADTANLKALIKKDLLAESVDQQKIVEIVGAGLFKEYLKIMAEYKLMNMKLDDYYSLFLKTINNELQKISDQTLELIPEEKQLLYGYCSKIFSINCKLNQYNIDYSKQFLILKDQWKKNHWNENVYTAGLGWIGSSSDNKWDSLYQNYFKLYVNGQWGIKQSSKVVGLFTMEFPFNKIKTDSTIVSLLFIGGRFLNGNAENRFSIDLGYNVGLAQKKAFDMHTLLFCIGYEYKITDGLFFELVSGYKGTPSDFIRKPHFMASGNLKFALQPKQRFSMNGK